MLQEQATQMANSALPIVKIDPRLITTIRMRTIGFWSLGIWVVLFAGMVISRISHIHISYTAYTTSILSLPAYVAIGFLTTPLMTLSAYRKIERKRQMAARGEQQLLADQQPISKEQVFSLPITISYQPGGVSIAIFWVLAIMLVLVIFENIWLGFTPFLVIITAIGIVVYCWMYISGRRKSDQELIADETGLTMKIIKSKKIQHISWSEARLFAIETIPNEAKLKVQTPRLFELSSEREVIFWPGSRKEGVQTALDIKPAMTDEQYNQQLQNLHTLIMEKTKLPLYDLRK